MADMRWKERTTKATGLSKTPRTFAPVALPFFFFSTTTFSRALALNYAVAAVKVVPIEVDSSAAAAAAVRALLPYAPIARRSCKAKVPINKHPIGG